VIGTRRKVHWNLHRQDFRVTAGGRVVASVDDITLADVEFRVQPAGLARIRSTGRRLVCAYATGIVVAVSTGPDVRGLCRIGFNPHREGVFVCGGEPVWTAELVIFKDAAGWVAR
jgi:hypothetical protein